MLQAAENLEFEEAAQIRDEIKRLETVDLMISKDPMVTQSAIRSKSANKDYKGRSKAGKGGTRVYKGKIVKRS